MKYFFTAVFFLFLFVVTGQVNEEFSDGNFTANPSWIGDDSVFTVVSVSGDFRLRSNKLIPSSSYYLSTPSLLATDTQWEFYLNLQFNTSSANYVDVYLTSNQSNLLSGSLSGYFVRIGGTTDEVSLYRIQSGVPTEIIDGADGLTNVSNNQLKIKVTCSPLGEWILKTDNTGTGTSYSTQGQITDNTLTSSAYFGIAITHSTASFIQKHFLDSLYIGPIIYDTAPPVLVSATATSSTMFDVLFDEPVGIPSAQTLSNYTLSSGLNIQSLSVDGVNQSLVHGVLAPSTPFMNGSLYTLTTNGVADVSGNSSTVQSVNFSYLVAENPLPGDVVINEFMADPSPSVGQPEFEYVEIFNRSSKYFNLASWKITDGASNGTIQSDWLYPGAYKVLCTSAAADEVAQTVAVSAFPSINNAADSLILKDNTGLVIDQLYFTDQWYRDVMKASGGYSLERINPEDPCSAEDNWIASESGNGGTPGVQNSVFNSSPDVQPPSISQLLAIAPNFLEVNFSEGMDSLVLLNAPLIVTPTLTVANKTATGTFPNSLMIEFNEQIQTGTVYQISFSSLTDCWGNTADVSEIFVLPDVPAKGDLVINEILFDPYTGGYDWIEVYNASTKLIDLKNWSLANFDNDTIDNQKFVEDHFYLNAGEYAVLGKDSVFVKQNYPTSVPGTFVYSETPSFNNDSSSVYLIWNGIVMDKVTYQEEWHFNLLDETDGVSLERIDPEGPSQEKSNWHSASEPVGFATPGGKNSQYRPVVTNGSFSFTSGTISPDNDGFEDVLQVAYALAEPALLGSCFVYDDRGRLITTLFKNELLGTTGSFTWDGVTENGVKASIGTYVLIFEAFSTGGGLFYTESKAFVVAGKL